VRPDGDPDRDDYGLPHVDVVVPDDARELDRDLIAYRREARQRRRRARLRRLVRPLTKYGVAAPIIALALMVAVISGALLTTLGPRPVPTTSNPPTAASNIPLAPSASPGVAGGPLPAGDITYGGATHKIATDLQGIIVLVPAACACDQTIKALAVRALPYNLKWFMVGAGNPDRTELGRLTTLATPGAIAAVDPRSVLAGTYRATGLTVLLVHTDQIVRKILPSVTSADLPSAADLQKVSGPGAGDFTPHA
jgi:hypothetical protein